MGQSFVQFLIDHELIPASAARQLKERRFIREPIGMIAVGHGILDPLAIDRILDQQRATRERFGDIAVRMGLLSRDQVEALARIQEFRLSADVSETLALSGVVPLEDAARYLGLYLVGDRDEAAVMACG